LVAAIYQRYAQEPINPSDQLKSKQILELKKQLGYMESYFHGKSSGLDPLICYLNFPVLIRSKEELGTVGLPETSTEGKGAIFLLNSGSPGKTQPMVNIFMERMKQEGFRNMIRKEFKKYNDACIQAFLKKDINPLFKNLKELSRLALEHFSPMIPSQFHHLWKEGIESNSYYLKLCGSGGGGYILGFTKDLEKARKKLSAYQLEVIHSF
jgi:mevalonate kinase